MTYGVGMVLDSGLVLAADTRTNAGVDNIATFKKLHVWERKGERVIMLVTAGNLAVTQAVVALLGEEAQANRRKDARPNLFSAPNMFQAARVVQKSMGMTGGSFNTREFFHGASAHGMRMARTGFQVLAFALPILLLAWALLSGSALAWLLALASQAAGLLTERWFFFAQARHPQNIYYQAVS